MKIDTIKLNSYLQFQQGLELDLTYPKGHSKQHEPLDKICFIGQSGTGKTALLNLIKYFTKGEHSADIRFIDNEELGQNCVEMHYNVGEEKYWKSIAGGELQNFVYKKGGATQSAAYHKAIESMIDSLTDPRIIYFPFNVIPIETPSDFINKEVEKQEFDKNQGSFIEKKNRKIWDVTHSDISVISSLVFHAIDAYVEKHSEVSSNYTDKIKEATLRGNTDESQDLIKALIKWENDNPNPIKEISEKFLNEIFSNIGLQIETDVQKYYNRKSEFRKNIENFLILKQDGKQIKLPFLSTGTKQIIFTTIPLFFLNPVESIILFDQPEASLYPNIQLLVPDIYTRIAPDNQFFFATHSPIVASAFDPWEIIELKFDETGKVYQELYYDADIGRTLDSYKLNPKYLRWDSILTKVFDLKSDGSEERGKLLQKLAYLEEEIKSFGEDDKYAKAEKADEYKKLARKILWKTDSSL